MQNQALEHSQALIHLLECLRYNINTKYLHHTRPQSFWVLQSTLSIWSYNYPHQDKADSGGVLTDNGHGKVNLSLHPSTPVGQNKLISLCNLIFYCNAQMALYNTLENHFQDYKSLVTLPPASLCSWEVLNCDVYVSLKTPHPQILCQVDQLSSRDCFSVVNHCCGVVNFLLKKEINMIIDSNASLQGQRVCCEEQTAGKHGHNRRQHFTSTV